MAVSEEGKSNLWRSPLSTPIGKSENNNQDLFQHLEKLIASTVSICRLKGSLECQTGGLITVAEELQRLVRFAVSEISRVERDLKRHKAKYEEEVNCLKDQIRSLEEERENFQEFINTGEADGTEHAVKDKRFILEGNLDGFDSASEEVNGEVSLFDDNPPDCKDSEEVQLPTDIPDRTLQGKQLLKDSKKIRKSEKTRMTKVGSDAEKGDVRKQKAAGKSVVSRKYSAENSNTDAFHTDDVLNNMSESESLPEVLKTKMDEEAVESAVNQEQTKSRSTQKKTKPRNSGKRKSKPEKENPPGTVKSDTQPGNAHPQRLDDEKPLDVDKKEEEETKEDETIEKRKRSLSSRSRERKEEKEKNNAKDSADGAEMMNVSEHQQIKDIDDDDDDDFESDEKPLSEVVQKIETVVSNVDATPKANSNKKVKPPHNSSSAKRTPKADEDEPLGNLSFLIDINTRISDFVTSDAREVELPPMTSRQRSDVHKLTKLYSVRGRFGSKTDSRTSMVLVKNADTKQPRAGKVDALLSELSIAASKETSATPRRKRKLVSNVDECEGNSTTEEDDENLENIDKEKEVPTKKRRKRKNVH